MLSLPPKKEKNHFSNILNRQGLSRLLFYKLTVLRLYCLHRFNDACTNFNSPL